MERATDCAPAFPPAPTTIMRYSAITRCASSRCRYSWRMREAIDCRSISTTSHFTRCPTSSCTLLEVNSARTPPRASSGAATSATAATAATATLVSTARGVVSAFFSGFVFVCGAFKSSPSTVSTPTPLASPEPFFVNASVRAAVRMSEAFLPSLGVPRGEVAGEAAVFGLSAPELLPFAWRIASAASAFALMTSSVNRHGWSMTRRGSTSRGPKPCITPWIERPMRTTPEKMRDMRSR
mmetsp:Transcript_27922/g.66532  ORF Transcript_27922/g.66532 Transcript_27922/m.66532 type:complete len:239 (+) Transcript_27922:394-1110(+)